MAMLKNNRFDAEFPSSIEYLEKVEYITSSIGNEVGLSNSETDDLAIAVTELFNNAIHHGNKDDENKKVAISFQFQNKQLKVAVTDQGEGFHPDKIDDPLSPENLYSERGRGIYLVKMMMDEIKFNITKNGSQIIIIKYLNGS
ncbi:MAG: hypothetical protein GF313_01345 [Caldithrix sp.]|nr:hypothetical protein [Caldithrix sp.]